MCFTSKRWIFPLSFPLLLFPLIFSFFLSFFLCVGVVGVCVHLSLSTSLLPPLSLSVCARACTGLSPCVCVSASLSLARSLCLSVSFPLSLFPSLHHQVSMTRRQRTLQNGHAANTGANDLISMMYTELLHNHRSEALFSRHYASSSAVA